MKYWDRMKKYLEKEEKSGKKKGGSSVIVIAPPGSVGFTGYGEDGKNQPWMPTGMVSTTQGPQMLHEGEMTMKNPDGSVRVLSQQELLQMQKAGMPGMATGGTYIPFNTNQKFGPSYGMSYQDRPGYLAQNLQQSGGLMPTAIRYNANELPKPSGVGGTIPQAPAKSPSQIAMENAMSAGSVKAANPYGNAFVQGQLARSANTLTTGTQNIAATNRYIDPVTGKWNIQSTLQGQTATSPTITATAPTPAGPQSTQGQDISATDRAAAARFLGIPEGAVNAANIQSWRNAQASGQGTAGTIAGAPGPTLTDNISTMIENRDMGNAGAAAQSLMGSAFNRMATSPGMTTGARMAGIQVAGRDIGSQLSNLEGTLAIDRAQRQENNVKWGYEQAIAAGDYNTASQNYQQLTGRPLDTAQFENDRRWVLDQRSTTSIANGSTFEQVNAERAKNGLAPMSQEEYNSVRAAGPVGRYEDQKQWTALTTTIAAKDWNGANAALKALGLPAVDFSQPASDQMWGNINTINKSIDDIVAQMPVEFLDTPEGQALCGQLMGIKTSMFIGGMQSMGMAVSDPAVQSGIGTVVSSDDPLGEIATNPGLRGLATGLGLTAESAGRSPIFSYFSDEPAGAGWVEAQIGTNTAFRSLVSSADSGDVASYTDLTAILTAQWMMENGFEVTNPETLDILKRYNIPIKATAEDEMFGTDGGGEPGTASAGLPETLISKLTNSGVTAGSLVPAWDPATGMAKNEVLTISEYRQAIGNPNYTVDSGTLTNIRDNPESFAKKYWGKIITTANGSYLVYGHGGKSDGTGKSMQLLDLSNGRSISFGDSTSSSDYMQWPGDVYKFVSGQLMYGDKPL